jgi:hypothetical protein
METLAEVQEVVEKFTKELFPDYQVANDGSIYIPFKSTQVFVRVKTVKLWDSKVAAEAAKFHKKHKLPNLMIEVYSVVLRDADRSQALYKWVATTFHDFGSIQVSETQDGGCNLIYSYNIAANTLDEGEYKNAVLAVATTSDRLDDELQPRFGGQRWVDYLKSSKE